MVLCFPRNRKGSVMREIRADYEQQFLLPPWIEDWAPPEHEVRFVRTLVQSLDLKGLGFKQRPAGPGAPYYAADTLLSVWLYGYMLKIRSSRQLETALHRRVHRCVPFLQQHLQIIAVESA